MGQAQGDAKDILSRLGNDIMFERGFANGWPPEVVGRYAQVLFRHYTPPDPVHHGAHYMGSDEIMRMQRDQCLQVLSGLAGHTDGWKAVDELTRLEELFPDWQAIPYQRMIAVERAGIATWLPPKPTDVLKFIRDGVPNQDLEEALKRLKSFLVKRFRHQDLRQLVRRLSQGSLLEAKLVGPLASLEQLGNSVVEVLNRACRIDKELFVELTRRYNSPQSDLDELAEMFGIKH